MPQISVILPTYNRRKTLPRAIGSVLHQTFTDWELIVVDDGSSDGTQSIVEGIDPRVRYVRQPNGGPAAARNTGLTLARGDFIGFLDSDDEWMPHFLSLTHAYLQAHPEQAFVATEFVQDNFGDMPPVQGLYTIRHEYLPLARWVGSRLLGDGEEAGDVYLQLYGHREPAGQWIEPVLARMAAAPGDVQVYTGRLAEQYRFGHLHALWNVLLRAQAVQENGPLAVHRRTCEDYPWLAALARRYDAALIAMPAVIKHEVDVRDTETAGHLATRGNTLRFLETFIEAFEEAFPDAASDPELVRLLGYRHWVAAQAALMSGQRAAALRHCREATQRLQPTWAMRLFFVVAGLCATPTLARRAGYLWAIWSERHQLRRIERLEAKAPTRRFKLGSEAVG